MTTSAQLLKREGELIEDVLAELELRNLTSGIQNLSKPDIKYGGWSADESSDASAMSLMSSPLSVVTKKVSSTSAITMTPKKKPIKSIKSPLNNNSNSRNKPDSLSSVDYAKHSTPKRPSPNSNRAISSQRHQSSSSSSSFSSTSTQHKHKFSPTSALTAPRSSSSGLLGLPSRLRKSPSPSRGGTLTDISGATNTTKTPTNTTKHDEKSDKYEIFFDWARVNGASFEGIGLEYYSDQEGGRGMVTVKPCSEDEIILYVCTT